MKHTVRKGDCIASVAAEYGFASWGIVWDAPENAELRALRSDPNVLLPGDKIVIPERRRRVSPVASGRTHTFTVRRPLVKLFLRLRVDGDPLAGVPFEATCEAQTVTGVSGGDGVVELDVAPTTSSVVVRVPSRNCTFRALLGHMNPETSVSGAKGRLAGLGLFRGPVDDALTPDFVRTLRDFQRAKHLDQTGELDGRTTDAITAASRR